MNSLFALLQRRGLIEMASVEFAQAVKAPLKVYLGIDPTAPSLHLGHLLGLIVLTWFQKQGHTPIVLIGGATGRIGDPSGRSTERPLLSEGEIVANVTTLRAQLTQLIPSIQIVDNYTWFRSFNVLSFLRDIGKYFRMGPMLAKESVKTRLASEEGMSFTEFSYQLLQGYDFYYMNTHFGVTAQVGGSDQWGNITAGIEYTRKVVKKTLHGMVFPLLTRSDGKKFGKSEGGALWLDKNLLSPYALYQYLYHIPDADVISLLWRMTFLDCEEIETLTERLSKEPNVAQKKLAEEVVSFVHGKEGLASAQKTTEAMRPGQTSSDTALVANADGLPSVQLALAKVVGVPFDEVMLASGLATSKSEVLRLVKNQGAYLNHKAIDDAKRKLTEQDLLSGKFLIIGSGKKKKIVVRIVL